MIYDFNRALKFRLRLSNGIVAKHHVHDVFSIGSWNDVSRLRTRRRLVWNHFFLYVKIDFN
jgi:hypothetical protein